MGITYAQSQNEILPDGTIGGLHLAADDELPVRDLETGIVVKDSFTISDNGLLNVIVRDRSWNSTIPVDTNVTPQLGGALRISFDPGANFTDLVGTSFDLFDWSGSLDESNRFGQVQVPPGTEWDVSQLYTTGEVVLTAGTTPLLITTTDNQTTAVPGESVSYVITVSQPHASEWHRHARNPCASARTD